MEEIDLNLYFKSIVDADVSPIVICNLDHKIIYMNPEASSRYEKRADVKLVGKSIFECHNSDSNEKIEKVVEWFKKSRDNNRMFTFHNEKENKDVYMTALRDKENLIGYYEKHEYRDKENSERYNFN